MRLGFHYHVPAVLKSDGIYVPGYLGRFIDGLACYCDEIVCFLHTPHKEEDQTLDHRIYNSNVRLISIGTHSSVPQRQLLAWKYAQPLRQERQNLDALLLRAPSPLLPAFAQAAGNMPLALLVVGDYLAGIDDLPQPNWRKEAIRLWSRWNRLNQMRVAKRSLTFVNSRLLYDQLRDQVAHLVETRTSTLCSDDFFERNDTCATRPIRLLYTGRIDRAKGLFEMVEALAILSVQGENMVLDLVGWPAKGDSIVEELLTFAEAQGISERVIYHGYRPVGPELFEFYRQADLYLLASKASEGFPRTIWEAMAHSLPVIATTVGSIPYFIEGAAELVPPKSAADIAGAISRLLNDSALRQGRIQRGRELARQNTVEQLSKTMIDRLEHWVTASR